LLASEEKNMLRVKHVTALFLFLTLAGVVSISVSLSPQSHLPAVSAADRLLYLSPAQNRGFVVQQISFHSTNATIAFSQAVRLAAIPTPPLCDVLDAQVSPSGRWLAAQISCEAGSYVLLWEVATQRVWDVGEKVGHDHFFLSWMPQRDEFIVQADHLAERHIYRVTASDGAIVQLPVPDDVYDLAFSPDEQRILYATSRGLGFGSELWIANVEGHAPQLVLADPANILAFARWSPNGQGIAYLRLPDSTVPFPMGEVWVMDGAGQNPVFLSLADAGRGFAPAWSPDGARLAFIGRENPNDLLAEQDYGALVSNIYLAELSTGSVSKLTTFTQTLVEQPVWSPDGTTVAFSAIANGQRKLWLADWAAGTIQPLPTEDNAAYPFWFLENAK
jgi:Tol biopolymer transport system component